MKNALKISIAVFTVTFITTLASAAPLQPHNTNSASSQPAAQLQGDWCWKQGDEELTLELKQSGKNVVGYHSAIGQHGAKVDEVAENQVASIIGEIKGDTALVGFRSGYPDSAGAGRARLTKTGKNLEWQILESKGEHYLPQKANLKPCPSKP